MNEGTRFRIDDGRIDWVEAAGLVVTFEITKAFLVFPEKIAKEGLTAAWTIPLVSGLLASLFIWVLVVVSKAHPGMNLIQITNYLAGPTVGFIAGVALYLYLMIIIVTGFREVADVLITVYMPLTPLGFFLASAYAVVFYVAFQNTETLARISVLTSTVVVGMAIILAALSIGRYNTDLVFPPLGPGLIPLFKKYGVRQSIYGEFLSLGMIAAYLREPRQVGKVAAVSLGISIFTFTLVVLTCQMVFPIPSLLRVSAPFLRVARVIKLGRFFQRLDSLFVFVWLGVSLLQAAVAIYLASLVLATVFHLQSHKPFVVLNVVAAYFGSWAIPNLAAALTIAFDLARPYGLLLLDIWPPTLLVLTLHKKKQLREGAGGA
ncbi:MAG: GerAB/ArcD/ProY family transporter [Candidatus Fermentithermobacillus carboniphilus]|uniref:GerAB/ArcD/ProY family transporter n=1 Tax=Candidatus Fermentithermobacillus carboniphilus TaxID=3085328 RepID=A0AAT9LC39_9FIRM|nr:MAG: GerAB/ArcD/ProY family transporter [Candidatus Fermentithermobacillus carboniphilus]